MRCFGVFLLLVISLSCSRRSNDSVVTENELQLSRWEIEDETNSKIECFKTLLIDIDTTYNSQQPEGAAQIFYRDFLRLKNLRDSIVAIKVGLKKDEWLSILSTFKENAANIHGTDSSLVRIEDDIRLLKKDFEKLPQSESGQLYKHIVARWTRLVYESVISEVIVDFVEGYKPPCQL